MLAHEIRRKYLEFFQEQGHLYLPSAPLVPTDVLGNEDKSILFSGSGMEQFKPYFAGTVAPPRRRVSTVQKCLRTNDIDSVGDFSHCTFFEMLGNFSFGDYFKAEVIPWTWEFLTKVVGLDPERLSTTIYFEDDEAYRIWHEVIGLPDDRIHRQGEDKNFWPASVISQGPDGPCGPNSEIFYRVAPLEEMNNDPALTPSERFLVDDAAGRYVEIWNNVFTQFDRRLDDNGKPVLIPLPGRNNDTGAGLDRIAYVSQGKRSVFETDLFGPTLARISSLSGHTYEGTMSPVDFAFRVVAEHTRSMVFCIADGILPGNEGRGYVLRYIMRRAIRYGKLVLGFEEPFLHEVAPCIIEQMGDFYPELAERQELILQNLLTEERTFRRTLDRGMGLLDRLLTSETVQSDGVLPGEEAFTLYDTHGFPYGLTEELSRERGVRVDREGFEAALERQRRGSQARSNIDKNVFSKEALKGVVGADIPATVFEGYTRTAEDASVLAIYQGDEAREWVRAGEQAIVVLDRTPFYAESGGQVGDAGWLTAAAGDVECALRADVTDTQKNALGLILHTVIVKEGELKVGQQVRAEVDARRRMDIMRNHTATHLVQAALRQVLGGHVHQKGSLVAQDRLRFDFTHGQALTTDEIRRVEEIVNDRTLEDLPIVVYTDLPIEEARSRGAMALFGEKYGDRVRMVEAPGFSLELCGGTHIERTSQIGLFKFISQSGVGSGVRRVEAVTGRGAYEYVNRQEEMIATTAGLLKANPNDLVTAVERLQVQRQELEKQIRQLKTGGGAAQTEGLTPQDAAGVPVVVSALEDADAETVANLADRTAQQLKSAVIVLGTVREGKVSFAAKITPDWVGQGLHAGNLVKEVARIAGGGGGGRPDFATAGGRDPGKLQEALDAVPALVAAQRGK